MRPLNISGSQAKTYYYEKDPIFDEKDHSKWHGKGAKQLFLSGPVNKHTFANIIAGNDLRGHQLVSDGVNGEHRACVDIPFSAPKSVSIMALHCGDEKVVKAHIEAVEATIQYIEENYVYARKTANGVTRAFRTGKGVFATFNHGTSRENDPQLHTHTLVMNMTETPDGWRATWNDQIFKDQHLLNSVYQSELAKRIREWGYKIENKSGGKWEIAGVKQEWIDTFSKRVEAINKKEVELKEKAEVPNAHAAKRRNVAVLDSRPDKDTYISPDELKAIWERQISSKQIAKSVKRTTKNVRTEYTPEDYLRMACKGIHETESTFKKKDLVDFALALSRGEYTVAEIDTAFNDANKRGEIVRLTTLTNSKGLSIPIFTSAKMKEIEEDIVADFNFYKDRIKKLVAPQHVQEQINAKYSCFTQGQKQTVEYILTSNDRFMIVQGDAGTGKTSAMEAVHSIVKAHGPDCAILGLGYTGKAAMELETKAGFSSETITGFLHRMKKEGRVGQNLPRFLLEWERGFRDDAKTTALAEKPHDTITPGQAEILKEGDGQAFSRARGYTEIEIKDFQHYINWVREGQQLGLSEDEISSIDRQVRQNLKDRKLWLVDESSMVGSVQMRGLMNVAMEYDAKVVFIGDGKQLQAIQAGKMFKELQDSGHVQTVKMQEVLRQKTDHMKKTVRLIKDFQEGKNDKGMDEAFQVLSEIGNITQVKNRSARLNRAAQDFISREKHEDTLLVTPLNRDRIELNDQIRAGLKANESIDQTDHRMTIRAPFSLFGTDAYFATNYRVGEKGFVDSGQDIPAGQEVQIVGRDIEKNTIKIETKAGHQHQVDLKKQNIQISLYKEEQRDFSLGEKIVFLKNDNRLNVQNGLTGTIEELKPEGWISVKLDTSEKLLQFNRQHYAYFDHGYAVTTHKSQGQTSKDVIFVADSQCEQLNKSELFNVAMTRAENDARIYTDDAAKLKDQFKIAQGKTSVIEMMRKEKQGLTNEAAHSGKQTASKSNTSNTERGME